MLIIIQQVVPSSRNRSLAGESADEAVRSSVRFRFGTLSDPSRLARHDQLVAIPVAGTTDRLNPGSLRAQLAAQLLDVDIDGPLADQGANAALDQFGPAEGTVGLRKQDRQEPKLRSGTCGWPT